MSPRLYGEFAPWYTLLTAPHEYEEEATWYAARMREHAKRPVRTVLELGCGAGANASFLKQWFEMELVDLSDAMLEECRRINPELPAHQGDMRTFRCPRKFDAVFVHDAVSYITERRDLAAVAETAAAHLHPGGVALFCPDDLRENFSPCTDEGGHDGDDGRALRYLSWSVEGPDDTVVTDFAYMLRAPDGTFRLEHDRHITGRHPQSAWVDALHAADLSAVEVVALEHADVEPHRHQAIIGVAAGP